MYITRVVMIRFAPEHKGEAPLVAERARAVFPTIPGVVGFQAGPAIDGDQDLVLLVSFADEAAVEPYRAHPIHVAFVEEELKPRMGAAGTLEARNFRTG